MGAQVIVSAHAPGEITKPKKTHKVGLRYAVLEA